MTRNELLALMTAILAARGTILLKTALAEAVSILELIDDPDRVKLRAGPDYSPTIGGTP